LAGLLFFAAAVLLALAAGGWWLQRVAFDPSSSQTVARDVLKDADIRAQIADVVAGAAAESVGIPANQLSVNIDTLAQNPAAAELLTEVIADAHARVIGSGGPVQITGAQMVNLVRDERAAVAPTVTLPVEEVPILDTIRTSLQWFVPIAALAGLAALVLGVLAHPERAEAFFGIGVFCILAAVLAMVLGYVVPAFVLPALNDNVWLAVIPAVAEREVPTVAGLSAALALVGVVLIFGASGFRRRKTSWSSPVRISRYSEQRRWS
jgi:hypothetical protein